MLRPCTLFTNCSFLGRIRGLQIILYPTEKKADVTFCVVPWHTATAGWTWELFVSYLHTKNACKILSSTTSTLMNDSIWHEYVENSKWIGQMDIISSVRLKILLPSLQYEAEIMPAFLQQTFTKDNGCKPFQLDGTVGLVVLPLLRLWPWAGAAKPAPAACALALHTCTAPRRCLGCQQVRSITGMYKKPRLVSYGVSFWGWGWVL